MTPKVYVRFKFWSHLCPSLCFRVHLYDITYKLLCSMYNVSTLYVVAVNMPLTVSEFYSQ